jgi:hypothetical protein
VAIFGKKIDGNFTAKVTSKLVLSLTFEVTLFASCWKTNRASRNILPFVPKIA